MPSVFNHNPDSSKEKLTEYVTFNRLITPHSNMSTYKEGLLKPLERL